MMRNLLSICVLVMCLAVGVGHAATQTEVEALLDEYLDMSDLDELRTYHDNLMALLDSDIETKLRARVQQRLGDVCYDLGRLRTSVSWYEKAQSELPELSDPYKSFVPMRLKRLKSRIRRENMLWTIYAVYTAVIGILGYRLVRSKGVDSGYLLKRGAIAVGISFFLGLAVLMVDRVILEPCGEGPALLGSVTKPVIQFSFFDVMPSSAFYTGLIFGVLPILAAVLHCAIRRRMSRFLLVTQIVVLSTALWGHFLLLYAYDEELAALAVLSPGRIYFDGDVETELERRPGKVMKAAKDDPNARSVFEQYIVDPALVEGSDGEEDD